MALVPEGPISIDLKEVRETMATENSVVVAVDGSKASQAAVRWAANTANKRGLPLRLVTSFTIPRYLFSEGMTPPQELFDDLEAQAKETIDEARGIAQEVVPDLHIEETIAESSPVDLLLRLSDEVPLIVMGSRGLGNLSGIIMGSVSAGVVSHASSPVVVVREDAEVTEKNKYGPVVVGVDGSDISAKATAEAFKEADARGAKLRAVHTWLDSQSSSPLPGVVEVQHDWESIEKEQKAQVEKLLEPHRKEFPDVEVEVLIVRNSPVRALEQNSKDAQLVVLGSHGRGGFRGMLLGSTSRALLQSASVPVEIVRPTKD